MSSNNGKGKCKLPYRAGRKPYSAVVYLRTDGGPDSSIFGRVWDSTHRRWRRRSLKHRDVERAIAWADDQAARLRKGASDLLAGQVTLGQVLDAYLRHHAARKAAKKARKADGRSAEMWRRVLGKDSDPHGVTLGQWQRFIDARAAGAIDARGRLVPERDRRPVSPRTVEKGCKWLLYVFAWATEWDVNGQPLMSANPLAGRRFREAVPRERNPKRPTATRDRYRALREHTDDVTMELRNNGRRTAVRSYLSELLDLAVATGRRITAICGLQYGDLLLERTPNGPHGAVRWRADLDKAGRESVVPINADARAALDRIVRERPGVGTAYMFPAPGNPAGPVGHHLAARWLAKAEKLAGLPPLDGGAWHPYRRMWATERKHLPAKDVAAAGGWATTAMVSEVYQQADTETTLRVVLDRGDLRRREDGTA